MALVSWLCCMLCTVHSFISPRSPERHTRIRVKAQNTQCSSPYAASFLDPILAVLSRLVQIPPMLLTRNFPTGRLPPVSRTPRSSSHYHSEQRHSLAALRTATTTRRTTPQRTHFAFPVTLPDSSHALGYAAFTRLVISLRF
jgi:hypothetical protein